MFKMNVCETIKVCIFGRGVDANTNIQLGGLSLSAAWGSSDANNTYIQETSTVQWNNEDDEEWLRLPMVFQWSTEEPSSYLSYCNIHIKQ